MRPTNAPSQADDRPAAAAGPGPVLRVRNLSVCFRTDRGVVTAVEDASFDVRASETLGIVGESGCGKTVTSKAIMRLLPERTSFLKPGSSIALAGRSGGPDLDLARAPESVLRGVRGARIAMVFQEPMTSLNPVFTVGWQIEEALKYHTTLDARARRARVVEMLRLVEIPNPERRAGEYPHQLSGGMRQRVMIAIALCCEPEVLIADEPTTALDVTIQAQILALMDNLRRRLSTAIVLITHNLGVVAQVCDRVMVMYAGRVVETGSVGDIFHRPHHPYTAALLHSIPKAGARRHAQRLPVIPGIVPSLTDLPPGCRFSDRCASRRDACGAGEPDLTDAPTPSDSPGVARAVRCFFPIHHAAPPAAGNAHTSPPRADP
ncbi:MAG: peptide ABC transporter ATP-binding protein [Planctomyces sp.]|nr:peptide ABC transporter ATP-binding protein [Planctomyces sp.]MBA4119756.1 peptide ABC transporter ATP-binding protein [Isosphaera sp.]